MSVVERPLRIGVVGAADASEAEREMARALGGALAAGGAIVLCGGRGGVMKAVAEGVAAAGGLTVGILPGKDGQSANRWIALPIPTGLGEARNAVLVQASEAVIAVGGRWGTLSEIAFAKKQGLSVGLLGRAPAEGLGLEPFTDAAHAASWALRRAAERRAG